MGGEFLSTKISPDEIIVRAIKTPYHVNKKKKKLKYQAYKPKAERDDVSVMRKRHLGNNGCKNKAVEICQSGNGDYIGLAALHAEEIDGGAKVVDSREGTFVGHAHIEQGWAAPPSGQTADPDLIERWMELADKARFYEDSRPDVEDWHEDDIT